MTGSCLICLSLPFFCVSLPKSNFWELSMTPIISSFPHSVSPTLWFPPPPTIIHFILCVFWKNEFPFLHLLLFFFSFSQEIANSPFMPVSCFSHVVYYSLFSSALIKYKYASCLSELHQKSERNLISKWKHVWFKRARRGDESALLAPVTKDHITCTEDIYYTFSKDLDVILWFTFLTVAAYTSTQF